MVEEKGSLSAAGSVCAAVAALVEKQVDKLGAAAAEWMA
jgi:hypothetical protein